MADQERLDREDRARVVRRRVFEVAGATLPPEPPLQLTVRDSLLERLRDRLPARLQGMAPFSALHLSALLVAVALVLFLLSWWVTRSGPRGESIPPPAVVAATPSLQTPLPTSTAVATPVSVVVDVAGKVRHPGVYRLPDGSRVIDALEAAGGARPGIDLAQVNLARVLSDGEQILILRSGSHQLSSGPGSSGGLVNINRADQSLLETLPGVGPVTAAAIVSWRDRNGPFGSVGDLVEVSGIGDATLQRLRPYITV